MQHNFEYLSTANLIVIMYFLMFIILCIMYAEEINK